ncbi:MAG: hypothetical protein HKN14_08700 [Marinicaulis sp.]|nr:hypothetical protein [Marinicaulis sp.]NNE40983.1 hypothetical protein [Marinicaulis sp.]
MNNYAPQTYTVKDLQEKAASGVAKKAIKPSPKPSRAARLELIDILSRRGSIGLFILFAATVLIVLISYSEAPARTAAWAIMVIAALWVSKVFQSRFRSGRSDNSRPFRWRAEYTAALSVVGVAFASAPELLALDPGHGAFQSDLTLIVLFAVICAALFHASHFVASMALIVPFATFFLLGQAKQFPIAPNIPQIFMFSTGFLVVLFTNRALVTRAQKRNPRSKLLRSEVESAAEPGKSDRVLRRQTAAQ